MDKQQVTKKEAAQITGKSLNTITNWIKAGKIDARKEGKIWLIEADSLTSAAGKKQDKKARPKNTVKKRAAKADIEGKQRVTTREAVLITGKSIGTINNWIKAGKVNATKDGRTWLIDVDSLKSAARKKRKKKARPKRVVKAKSSAPAETIQDEAKEKLEALERQIAAMKQRREQIERDNERYREREFQLRERIQKVFGPVFGSIVERLLEIK